MLLKTIVIICLYSFISISTIIAQEATFYGSRNEALARATIALSDSWALFYNPAALIFNKTEISAGYQSKYTSLGIDDGAFGFTFPIKNTALGIGASYFGDHLLNKTKVVGSIAHGIGKTTLGIKTTFDQLRIDEIGSKGIFYFAIGGQIHISDQVILGLVINNINQAKFDTTSLISPKTNVQVGINYHPHNKLTLLAQIEKDVENPAQLKLALEYSVSNIVQIRTGVIPSPSAGFAGIGLHWFNIKLDLSGSYQQTLGWSGGLSIGIPLSSSDED